MCRRDHLRADLFRCADFREAEPRHIGVNVHDIRRRMAKPLVKQFGAANDDASLSLIARGPRRNRVPIHLEPVQVVGSLRLPECLWRRDQHLVSSGPQSLRQLGYVDFGAAI